MHRDYALELVFHQLGMCRRGQQFCCWHPFRRHDGHAVLGFYRLHARKQCQSISELTLDIQDVPQVGFLEVGSVPRNDQ